MIVKAHVIKLVIPTVIQGVKTSALVVRDVVQLVILLVQVHVIKLVVRLVIMYVVMDVIVPVLNYAHLVVEILLREEINELR